MTRTRKCVTRRRRLSSVYQNRRDNIRQHHHHSGAIGFMLLGTSYTTLGHPWGALVPLATKLGNLSGTIGDDNLTMMLVENFTGAVGQDLDTNNDGVFDITPWTVIDDSVGWLDPD